MKIFKPLDNQFSSGVILSEGKTWVEQRRFALRTLRDFGFGKQGMEELIEEEVELFKALILKNGEESFDFINKLNLPILNALWRLTVGERFEYDDPKLISIVHRLTEAFKRFGKPEAVMVFAFPWITKIYPKAFGRDETLSVNHDIQDLITESIKQHQQTLGMGSASHWIVLKKIHLLLLLLYYNFLKYVIDNCQGRNEVPFSEV